MNTQPTSQNSQLNPQTLAIVKAIAYTENGGAPDIGNPSAGQSGEMKSTFQFMPDTWKIYSKQVFGSEKPLTPQNESLVVYQKVDNWLKEGYTVKQIASMWNAGEQKPDAYLGNQGKNKQGVPYNTTKYATKVDSYAKQFGHQDAVTTSQTQPSTVAMTQPTSQPVSQSGMVTPPFTLKQQKPTGQPGMIKQSKLA